MDMEHFFQFLGGLEVKLTDLHKHECIENPSLTRPTKLRTQLYMGSLDLPPRDVRNLILRPETITNMSLYVGFELRNQNQHA